jgi:hypothetical protein
MLADHLRALSASEPRLALRVPCKGETEQRQISRLALWMQMRNCLSACLKRLSIAPCRCKRLGERQIDQVLVSRLKAQRALISDDSALKLTLLALQIAQNLPQKRARCIFAQCSERFQRRFEGVLRLLKSACAPRQASKHTTSDRFRFRIGAFGAQGARFVGGAARRRF